MPCIIKWMHFGIPDIYTVWQVLCFQRQSDKCLSPSMMIQYKILIIKIICTIQNQRRRISSHIQTSSTSCMI